MDIIEVANGSLVLVIVMVVSFFGIVYGYFTEAGSGITARPYGKIYGGAPGAFGPSYVSGRDERERVAWSRGTR
jgi:hypothetical protein